MCNRLKEGSVWKRVGSNEVVRIVTVFSNWVEYSGEFETKPTTEFRILSVARFLEKFEKQEEE